MEGVNWRLDRIELLSRRVEILEQAIAKTSTIMIVES